MKKLHLLFSVILAALVVFGCGNTPSTPEEVAIAIAKASMALDFKTIKNLSDAKAAAFFEEQEKELDKKIKEAGEKRYQEELAKGKEEAKKLEKAKVICEGSENEKICKIYYNEHDIDKQPLANFEYSLVKENGSWKLHIPEPEPSTDELSTEPMSSDTGLVEPEPAHGSGH